MRSEDERILGVSESVREFWVRGGVFQRSSQKGKLSLIETPIDILSFRGEQRNKGTRPVT